MRGTDFLGITWSHPRGYAPLEALARLAAGTGPLAIPDSTLRWERQGLAGFEAHPIADLAGRFDLVVLDHPGLGDAADDRVLRPLETVFSPEELATWSAATVVGCYDSYRYSGHQWALPIDAATQVCAVRPDLLEGEQPPGTWADALRLADRATIAVPTKDPHTLLTFLGIAAAVAPGFEPDDDSLVPAEAAATALDVLTRVVASMSADLLHLDPIELLDRMSRQDLACVPLVFGYVTYSAVRAEGNVIRFVDAPAINPTSPPGSVLGGTGLAISARRPLDSRLLDHVRACLDEHAQTVVFPRAGGQPSAVATWESATDQDWQGFYSRTRRSMDGAWRRPRFPGWIPFQSAGSRLLLKGILQGRPAARLLAGLDALYRLHRPPGFAN